MVGSVADLLSLRTCFRRMLQCVRLQLLDGLVKEVDGIK